MLIETGLLFLFLFLKSARVNAEILRVGQYVLPIAAFTVLLFSALAFCIRIIFRRDHMPVLFGIYAVLSVFMLIDAVYCGYTGKLPSAVMLRYTGQLGDVKEAIYANVTLSRLLYAIDIPVWIVYFTHFRKKLYARFAEKNTSAVSARVLCGGAVLVSACICAGYCLFTPFVPSYFENEILSYHILDFGDVLFPRDAHMVLDEALLPGNTASENRGDEVPTVPVISETAPHYGIAAGRNVITVQVEALQDFVLGMSYEGQVVTPNLNALMERDTFYFENYYYQIGGGNTADAEFAVNNSLFAPDTVAAYEAYRDNDYYSMATLLKEHGYGSATAFHGYKKDFWFRDLAYPGQGFDAYLSGSDFYAEPEEVAGMGVSDGEFFTEAVEYLAAQYAETGLPFYAFMITLSSHYAFELPAQYNTLTLKEEHVGTLFGNYLQAIHYFDTALGMLLDALRANDLYDNTVITLYGDHFGLPVYDWQSKAFLSEQLGRDYTYGDHFNVPLLVHIPGMDAAETVSVTGGHIDVMPTLLHLLGIENEGGIMFGQNLLCATEGIVYQQTHLARGSFISDTVFYQHPFTGITVNAEANNVHTWEVLDPAPFAKTAETAKKRIEQCMYLLDRNLILTENYRAALGEMP